uniref:TFIIS n=1 Tax=Ditylenchus dipsaci TaxID=166011 RepID=A0A915EN43_9BILA
MDTSKGARRSSAVSQNGVSELREKSVEMLANAFRVAELPEDGVCCYDPEALSSKIETILFEIHHGVGDKYKAALRSRVFNLRDKKNPALRENLLTGAVTAEKFAVMTAQEMASDDMRKTREKFSKESIEEHKISINEGTPSDMFRCGKCGNKNCTYNQVQTRSADEPMTTYVFCRDCGNRWKFN